MQVTLNAGSPAESRLIAAFLQDLADLQEQQIEESKAWMQQHGFTTTAPSAPTQAEAAEAIAPAKKSRSKKTDPSETPASTATEPASSATTSGASTVTEPASSQSAEGNASATTAEPAVVSGSSENAEPAAKAYSTDDLRKLFGDLAQKGRRDKAVAIVRSYGYNGIAAITADKQDEIGAKLDALLAEPEEV